MSDEYVDYVLELLEPVGRVKPTRFFGGIGLSRDSVQFGFIMENTTYFVVDDSTRARYEASGMKSFSYQTKKRRVQVRRYFEVPEDVLTDPDTLRVWASESLRVAALKKKKPARKRS